MPGLFRLKFLPLVQVVRAQQADVSADYVLGIGGFDLDRIADEVRGTPCTSNNNHLGAAGVDLYNRAMSQGMLRAGRGMGAPASHCLLPGFACFWPFSSLNLSGSFGANRAELAFMSRP